MKGPVPRAALLRSPYFLMPASLMMKPQKLPRAARSPANGSLVTNLIVYLPMGSILSTVVKSALPGDFSTSRSKVNLMSAEVSSWPSWNFTPCRSLNVHVSPSGLICHDSASSGTAFMSGSKRMSWLYINGERRLRDKAGTSCGSRPVASVVWAEIRLPPGFGVCARAGRATDRAPSASQPAFSTSRRVRECWRSGGMGAPPLVFAAVGQGGSLQQTQVEFWPILDALTCLGFLTRQPAPDRGLTGGDGRRLSGGYGLGVTA